MSMNDRKLDNAAGIGTYPGVANPTASGNTSNPLDTNFVTDPTTESRGAGAGPNFEGDRMAQRNIAGVVESRPGIFESTHIDPLDESKSEADEWKNTKRTGDQSGVAGTAKTAINTVKEVFRK